MGCMVGCGKSTIKSSNSPKGATVPNGNYRPAGRTFVGGNTEFGTPKIKLRFGSRNR